LQHPATADGVDWDEVQRLDLVYQPDCWRACGDAHCCSFARHKQRFRLLGGKPFQELPLLPGELEHMTRTGAVAQFGDFTHKKVEFAIDGGRAIHVESIVSSRPGCACDHATRPTVCRLYPLFPVHDVAGRLLAVEPAFGIYEELERLDGLEPACALRSLPFDQLQLFLRLAALLAQSPVHLFHLQAYRIAKQHVVANLQQRLAQQPQSAFPLFEWLLLKGRAFDREPLRQRLQALADEFRAHYGARFVLPAPAAAAASPAAATATGAQRGSP
jgi:hypothetical protein